jgi:hypothetical protein
MKLNKRLITGVLCFSLNLAAFGVILPTDAFGQDAKVALQRGYRTGYSDGYMAGYRDVIDNAAKNFSGHGDYQKANRAFNQQYGPIEDYQDGYRQGFELGYAAGYEKRSFEAKVPENLTRRPAGQASVPAAVEQLPEPEVVVPITTESVAPVAEKTVQAEAQPQPQPAPAREQNYSENSVKATPGTFVKTTFTPVSDAVIIIPKDTEMILELQGGLTTATAKEGDRFIAKIVSPTEIAGAVVEGHIANVIKPGRIKRRSEIHLSFNRIILNETRWSNFDAQLTEIFPVKGDNVKRVDNEGTAAGTRPHKSDAMKIGVATGAGVTIGAIAGGPVGAAVGAGVGAAFGVGAVVIERGKHINLSPNQQLRVRTSYETQIR